MPRAQGPKSRRTPSPYRRRSPARRPAPRQRHRTPDPPRRSRTPSRNAIVLTTARRSYDPTYITTPDADDTWGNWHDRQPTARRPRSPPGPPATTRHWAQCPSGLLTGTRTTPTKMTSSPLATMSLETMMWKNSKQQQLTPTGSIVLQS